MNILVHRHMGNWPRFLLFPCIAVAGYLAVLGPLEVQAWWVIASWVAILSYCWFCLSGSFHEASHGSLFRSRVLNEIYGQIVGIIVLIPFSSYRATHRWHHAYLNTPRDFELWPYSDPHSSLWFRRVFVLVDTVFGVITAPVIYGRIFFSPTARLTQQERRAIALEYSIMAIFWSGLILSVGALIYSGRYQPRWLHLCYLLPLMISPMINTVRKFIEHLGMESIDQVQGTRTIAGKNWFTSLASYFLFDISVHGVHHRYPKVPCTNLKHKLQEMQQNAPDRQIPVYATYWQALRHTLPALWKNPAVGTAEWHRYNPTAQNAESP
ncbi:MAG: fatty acid desaturase [Planctomycetaceae bacterium]|nr:fatty acid desaturase [Planctomycetaceae bacterium]